MLHVQLVSGCEEQQKSCRISSSSITAFMQLPNVAVKDSMNINHCGSGDVVWELWRCYVGDTANQMARDRKYTVGAGGKNKQEAAMKVIYF